MTKIDFKTINEKAIDSAEKVVSNWVPNGSRNGNEWIALNPTRNDSSKGSFSINLLTGIWKAMFGLTVVESKRACFR